MIFYSIAFSSSLHKYDDGEDLSLSYVLSAIPHD